MTSSKSSTPHRRLIVLLTVMIAGAVGATAEFAKIPGPSAVAAVILSIVPIRMALETMLRSEPASHELFSHEIAENLNQAFINFAEPSLRKNRVGQKRVGQKMDVRALSGEPKALSREV